MIFPNLLYFHYCYASAAGSNIYTVTIANREEQIRCLQHVPFTLFIHKACSMDKFLEIRGHLSFTGLVVGIIVVSTDRLLLQAFGARNEENGELT